ncbi:protein GVQW3-like [Mya arenaria]|uniref:protein GVQW3-like n=1 Tax=Mya arenaria TaxID=6604 RepID=UPI0022E83588|nr:protein GVQW3-like [Mya arenaria]
MTSNERTEQRSVIKFCVNAGMTLTDTWKFICSGNTGSTCSRRLVFKWHDRFRHGDTKVADIPRSGRPKSTDAATVQQVAALINDDRRRTVREISDIVDLGRSVIHNILISELQMNKVGARLGATFAKT